jgi:hypothetical protein
LARPATIQKGRWQVGAISSKHSTLRRIGVVVGLPDAGVLLQSYRYRPGKREHFGLLSGNLGKRYACEDDPDEEDQSQLLHKQISDMVGRVTMALLIIAVTLSIDGKRDLKFR